MEKQSRGTTMRRTIKARAKKQKERIHKDKTYIVGETSIANSRNSSFS